MVKSVFLHLTTRCNLRCAHCYAAAPAAKDLPAPVVFRVIDELKSLGGGSVTLSGGEPLLHPDIRRILKHAASTGLHIQLLSNGTLIDKETAELLAGEADVSVQISVDGSTPELHDAARGAGAFVRTLRGLDALRKAGLTDRLTLSTTVMRQNLHDLPDIVRLAQALGIPKVRFLPLRRVGRAAESWSAAEAHVGVEDYEGIFDAFSPMKGFRSPGIEVARGLGGFILEPPEGETCDHIWCPVGRTLTLSVDGDAFPCVLMMRPEFRLGNIHRDGLGEMIRSAAMLHACEMLAQRRNLIPKCTACLWKNFCQAGCMGQALDETDTVTEPDSFCEYRRKAYGEAFDTIIRKFERETSSGSER